MNSFIIQIKNALKYGYKSITVFPTSFLSALGFAIVTIIRIEINWQSEISNNYLFSCLHWSLAFGAFLGLAVLTVVKQKNGNKMKEGIANVLVGFVVVLTFFVLYFLESKSKNYAGYYVIADDVRGRMIVMILLSILTFILNSGSNPASSLFMTQKAMVVALLYGIVVMSGASSVAAAVKGLLYPNLTEKIFMYVSVFSGLLAFSVFLGHFPDFSLGEDDPRRAQLERQPNFVKALFQYILVPIILVMTGVLILWVARVLLQNVWPPFVLLSSVSTTYVLSGIWLHMMVSEAEIPLVKLYRRIFPVGGLLVLLFEVWAIMRQISHFGIKYTEYAFVVLVIFAVISTVLLIFNHKKAYVMILMLVGVLGLVMVMPYFGYYDLPVRNQISRLEETLIAQEMLVEGVLQPANHEISLEDKEMITDAAMFLIGTQEAPSYLSQIMFNPTEFKKSFGFEPTYSEMDEVWFGNGNKGLTLELTVNVISSSDYDFILLPAYPYREGMEDFSKGAVKEGEYKLLMLIKDDNSPGLIQVVNAQGIVMEVNMSDYYNKLLNKYPLKAKWQREQVFEDLVLRAENDDLKLMVVFRYLEISMDPQGDQMYYYADVLMGLLKEK
ncbi:MAG: DUF4153 domain-containing protein [Clostridia bacterium]|nr:DUF4153 domain-containing protein [Clostridia bacterium]